MSEVTESERTWARGTRNAASANFEWDEKKKFRVRKREGERDTWQKSKSEISYILELGSEKNLGQYEYQF